MICFILCVFIIRIMRVRGRKGEDKEWKVMNNKQGREDDVLEEMQVIMTLYKNKGRKEEMDKDKVR